MDSFQRVLKKMGYADDREGLITRYMSQAEEWKSHLEHTRNFILRSAQNKKKGRCVVFGSGWWLDVPVAELAEMFEELVLVDITHPVQIEKKAKAFPNVRLIQADVTGQTVNIYNAVKAGTLDNLRADVPCNFGLPVDFEADFYVSPNLLSQLGGLISEYLEEKTKSKKELIDRIVAEVEQNHISMLPVGKSCLIVDFQEEITNAKSSFMKSDMRVKVPMPEGNISETWIWDFDLAGNYITNSQVRFRVRGVDF
jgi:hypothetical protein